MTNDRHFDASKDRFRHDLAIRQLRFTAVGRGAVHFIAVAPKLTLGPQRP